MPSPVSEAVRSSADVSGEQADAKLRTASRGALARVHELFPLLVVRTFVVVVEQLAYGPSGWSDFSIQLVPVVRHRDERHDGNR